MSEFNNLILLQVQSTLTAQELESYGDAGAVVEEVLSSLRTVVAFGGENKEVARYELSTVMTKPWSMKVYRGHESKAACVTIPLLSG
jgi:methionine aminopeptidase